MKNKKPEILAEDENGNFIQGNYADNEKSFEWFDIFFCDNATMVSLPIESFAKIVDLFRTIIDNEKKPKGEGVAE